MIICINCSKQIKAKMDALIKIGEYGNYSELVTVALENLFVLEREVAEKGALVIADAAALPIKLRTPRGAQRGPQSGPGEVNSSFIVEKVVSSTSGASAGNVQPRIPDVFLFEGLERLSVVTAEIPPTEKVKETFTLDRWLFGQYNKLLPAKANCRALIRLIAGKESCEAVDRLAYKIAEAAGLLGDYLAEHDRRYEIGRDAALVTAFPSSSADAEKSRARYANQFVGSVNNSGVLSGLLWDYRLAALVLGQGACLFPTAAALKFAGMANPVLDSCQTEPAQKFSQEEVDFLFDHIRCHIPVEEFAFRTLIEAIANGADTPAKLDEALHLLVPADSNRSLSQSFLASQRSGALSRMADLGLIVRVRKGVKVSYTITGHGEAFVGAKRNNSEKENG